MKKILLILLCILHYVFAGGFYQTNLADAEVFVISLQKSAPPAQKLIAEDTAIKDKAYLENEHNIMLIKQANFIALVDTGFPHTVDVLRSKLKEQGVEFADITHILLTHGHKDHLGGILNSNGVNNFPNAKLVIDKREYDFWIRSQDSVAKQTLESFGKKIQFTKSNKPIFDSQIIIKPIPAYGHTPGHTLFSFEDTQRKIVFIGDLLHVYEAQIANPRIAIEYDVDKQEAVRTRLKLFKTLQGVEIVGVHTPFSSPRLLQSTKK